MPDVDDRVLLPMDEEDLGLHGLDLVDVTVHVLLGHIDVRLLGLQPHDQRGKWRLEDDTAQTDRNRISIPREA